MRKSASCRDVLEVAIAMEEFAGDFYRAMAEGSTDPRVRQFCRKAMGEEARHQVFFRDLRDQEPQSALALQTELLSVLIRDAQERLRPDRAFVRRVAMGRDPGLALEMAVAMEESAVDFYQRLLPAMPNAAETIERITGEEKKHVTALFALAGRVLR